MTTTVNGTRAHTYYRLKWIKETHKLALKDEGQLKKQVK